jgi:DNA-binding PadR family transcriptional regulator
MNPKVKTTKDIAEVYTKPIEEKYSKLEERVNGWDKRVEDYNRQEARNRVKDSYSLTDDGLASLEKMMEEKGVKDYDIAATYWQKTNPPTTTRPSSYVSNEFGFSDMFGEYQSKDEDLKRMAENPDRYADEQVRKFFSEKANSKGNQW